MLDYLLEPMLTAKLVALLAVSYFCKTKNKLFQILSNFFIAEKAIDYTSFCEEFYFFDFNHLLFILYLCIF